MDITFVPHVPLTILATLSVVSVALCGLAAWRGLQGWPLRALAACAALLVLANPVLHEEERLSLSDIVVLMVDETSSQTLGNRAEQTEQMIARVTAQVSRLPNTELRIVPFVDAPDNRGTQMMTRLSETLLEEPRARVAGVILLTDGRLHDADIIPDLPAPLHVLLTGAPQDWDRRLILRKAPSFAILDEEIRFTLEIEDQGAVPEGLAANSDLFVSIDGEDPIALSMPVGRELEVPITLRHGGINTLHFTIPAVDGELTDRNNQAVVQINGVRDRLRVLLVSGEPHNGERTWRNILNSDAAVDLVHFTILRPLEKQDGVPITELALVAFPTRELFLEKVDDFDLIIFDRYKLRGILPDHYFENIARYAEDGGAILVSAGPDFATANSLYRSSLSRVLPARPTGRLFEEGFTPQLTNLGRRHPVTQGLDVAHMDEAGQPTWGRWFRQVDLDPLSGDVVMSGINDQPLLVLDHVGEGRVAVLGSDHAWLWARGFEGGGPQAELLRRLGHWMMQEPELEEEMLSAQALGADITLTRRTLSEIIPSVTLTAPDGIETTVELEEQTPGLFSQTLSGQSEGIYRLRDTSPLDADSPMLEAVVIVGPAAAREFEQTIATAEPLAQIIRPTRGGTLLVSTLLNASGTLDLRTVRQGGPAAGRNWLGITPRGAYETLSHRTQPMLPAWLWAVLIAGLAVGAWLREGRRS